MTTVRTVLVDDHELVLQGLSNALERRGMNVVGTFSDQHATLQFLGCHEVDFLVVDLRLRDQSGIDVVAEAHRRYPSVKIAILTSFADAGSASAAIKSGATGFLLKDTPTNELCRQLGEAAAGHLVIDSRVATAVLAPTSLLTDQEITVLEYVADGLTNKEIGARMFISHYTVKDYLRRAMRKLDSATRAETVAKAVQKGLLGFRSVSGA